MSANKSQSAKGILSFLREKAGHYSFKELFKLELEGYLFWIFGSVPGILGFTIRNAIARLLFKDKRGMVWIQPRVTLVHCDRMVCGKMLGVNSGSYLNAVGGLTLGDYVLIGSNVTISSGVHPIDGETPPVYARPVEPLPIAIEDDVWIGAGSVIMPGVTLRKGTVVGANSVVTTSTESYAVVVGAPARKLRSRAAMSDQAK